MANPATGKDTKITITIDGALKKVFGKVVNHRKSVQKTTITTKVIGESGSYIDKEFDGIEGTVEIATDSKSIDEAIDLIDAAEIAGVPVVVALVETTKYRDLTSKTYAYADIKIDWEHEARRGDAQKHTFKWVTGLPRAAL